MNPSFEPKILAFLCNWCSYAGADLAGISRIQYPPNIRVIRTMCSGRVDPLFIVNALDEGFDGVYVGGCHIGDCHYQDGNLYTLKRFDALQKLMDLTGISRNRVHLKWASAAEAQIFADNITYVTQVIRDLGPFERDSRLLPLQAMKRTLTSQRYRWLVGIDRKITGDKNVYNEKTPVPLFEKVFSEALQGEYQKALVVECTKDNPLSVHEISGRTGLPPYTISCRLNELSQDGITGIGRVDGRTPKFISRAA
ncbi:MAG: hydrogenase iron-sulfur subunit [Desulfobacteraceae bacterium]|nr:MAG: hydrogenase iron-sulfur subunit [Desulfobacteraceae bacterium]